MAIMSRIAILLLAGLATAASSACGEEDGLTSCPAEDGTGGPRAGHAMLQTERRESGKSKRTMPLAGRLQMVETEVNSLNTRVATLQGEVGMDAVTQADFTVLEEQQPLASIKAPELSAPADEEWAEDQSLPLPTATVPAVAPAATKPSKKHHKSGGRRSSLLEVTGATTRDDSLKGRTAAMEASVAALKSKVEGLENQVWPEMRDASLLSTGASTARESTLTSRIVALEKSVDDLRTRASSLEHVVMG
jgi:hypothetical protein